MSLSQALLPELDQEMQKTRKVLERIPLDRFDWKPHEKSFSMGELANHTAQVPGWGAHTLATEEMDLEPADGPLPQPPVARTTQELLQGFDEGVASFREAVEKAGDEALMTPWTLLQKGEALFTLPRSAVIRTMILNHLIHHRGQLSVYLRLNDVPVPAIYGPSADEMS